MKTKKIELSTIISLAVIAVVMILAIVFFLVSKEYKTTCTSYNVSIITCKNQLAELVEGTPEYAAKLAEISHFQGLKDKAALTYNVFACLAYAFSILFLISVGVALAYSSRLKEKRDNAVSAA
jgi:hypothetical protein